MGVAAVDLFCGAGGLSYGLHLAGVQVVAGFDTDPACAYPYEHNVGGTFYQADIAEVASDDLLLLWPTGCARVLAGCAPCQPFSYYTQGKKSVPGDPRWQLLGEFKRLVQETEPDVVTMENVPKLEKHAVFAEFMAALTSLGYHVSQQVVQCLDFGVPQYRSRLVVLASRLGPIRLVAQSKGTTSKRCVADAIRDLPPLAAGSSDPDDPLHRCRGLSGINRRRLRASSPGGTWRDWPSDLRAPCHQRATGQKYASVYGRMTWSEPAPTITTECYNYGSGRFGHPEQERAISLREAALLQSFPGDYAFIPDDGRVLFEHLGRLIGNAVPPALGKAIGRSIVEHIQHIDEALHHAPELAVAATSSHANVPQ